MLVKMYVALLVAGMVAIAALGAFSIKRCGCRLYERFCVPQAEFNAFWGATAAVMAMTALYIAQPMFSLGCTLAEKLGGSMMTGGFLAIAITMAIGLSYGLLARIVFGVSKKVAVSILRKQQVKQRETCRQLHQQMAEVDFAKIPCEDAFSTYANCRKEIAAVCPQPEPVKCPVGVKRPLGYVDGTAVIAQLKAMGEVSQETSADGLEGPELFNLSKKPHTPLTSAIVTVSLHGRTKSAQKRSFPKQGEAEFFNLDKKTSPDSVVMTVPFVPYYEESAFCLTRPHARELERVLDNFVSDDKTA